MKHAMIFCMMLALFSECDAADKRKPILWIALDDGWRSTMLKCEMERDWTRPNPAIKLTIRDKRRLAEVCLETCECQRQIRRRFVIRYCDPPMLVKCAAIRINNGAWETIDSRAFLYETRPIRTIDWYRRINEFARDTDGRDDSTGRPSDCQSDGYSGPSTCREPYPPWVIFPQPKN